MAFNITKKHNKEVDFKFSTSLFYIYFFNANLFKNNFFIRKIIFKRISSPAPGSPKNPTSMAVIMFSPIWKPKLSPTILIMYIQIPPKNELIISFTILFSGIINIFPNINSIIIQAKKVIITLISKVNSPLYSFLWFTLDKYYF